MAIGILLLVAVAVFIVVASQKGNNQSQAALPEKEVSVLNAPETMKDTNLLESVRCVEGESSDQRDYEVIYQYVRKHDYWVCRYCESEHAIGELICDICGHSC